MRAPYTLAVLGLVTGCFSNNIPSGYRGRTAENAPPRFETSSNVARIAPADTLPGSGCLSPLHDPRDGTKLILYRSYEGIGDYEVPDGKYGVGRRELLRIDCNTGEVRGIVGR
ncbi:MAG TPA: hypothetical protein VG817_12095 [Gemmatimonadales bacterium]|nr:hypothetical protein [Gemmatimonadales bacterium]